MPKSYRIRTQPGVDKNIRVEINQDFDFLEILSLKLRQDDVYSRFCADYGVVVGRVITNGGYGIPNAKISVFVPLDELDIDDPIISTLYPYRNLGQKNEDGYRYNLLPYEQSYQGHTPTGTFPTENDILTRQEVLEIYEKYYKYTVKTNESGDFMIIGVPLGIQKVVMDLDLSDMGCFSLRPSDLIRMGMASQTQVAGQEFRASTDLATLPQIINSVKDVDVASFWGQEDLCTIGITRVDFDLRDFGISIQPHAVFMGSIFSTPDEDAIRERCNLKNSIGKLCELTTGPGQILSIRQTTGVDIDGRPVLEEYKLENGGNVIDGDGAWLIELPMNLDYVVTNEFGEQVLSNDPSVGVPTKSKYRFKIKWQNEGGLTNEVQRGNYLVPNIKEYAGINVDTNASYAFSLDWNDYGDKNTFGSLTALGQQMIDEAINCEDRFYEFHYNKVYTISSHIDRFKFGFGDKRHIGIKNIDDSLCKNSVNKFPVNDGEQNSGGIFLLDVIMYIVRALFFPLLFVMHIVFGIMRIIIGIINAIKKLLSWFKIDIGEPIAMPTLNLPMISYPDCENCNCSESYNEATDGTNSQLGPNLSVLANINDRGFFSNYAPENNEEYNKKLRWLLAGNEAGQGDGNLQRVPYFNFGSGDWGASKTPNLAHRMNLINQRQRYFNSQTFLWAQNLGGSAGEANMIKTTVKNKIPGTNTVDASDPLYDNVIILLCDPGTFDTFGSGNLISFSDVGKIEDSNLTGLTTNQFGNNALTGTSKYNANSLVTVTVPNLRPNGTYSGGVSLKILADDSSENYYKYKSGVEYFQIITGSTVSQWQSLIGQNVHSLIRNSTYSYQQNLEYNDGTINNTQVTINPLQQIPDYLDYDIILLTRGVDPHTKKQTIEYDISVLCGQRFGNIKIEGEYYLNIPMQQTSSTGTWRSSWLTPESHNITSNSNNTLFHPSFTFTPDSSKFISFYSKELLRYSSLDKSQQFFTAAPNDSPEYPKTYTVNGSVAQSWDRPSGTNYLTNQYYIEGASLISLNGIAKNKKGRIYSPVYYNGITVFNGSNGINIINSNRIVFRSDRLPTSDQTENHYGSSFLLHQNQKFAIYTIGETGAAYAPQIPSTTNNTTGSQDFTGSTSSAYNDVITSMSCNGMVRLDAYEGYGKNLTIDENKNEDILGNKDVINGCYRLVKIPVISLPNDIILFFEWYSRYRMMAAICNGALAQMFQNNWVNGTLYMPSFDKGAVYNSDNEVDHYTYCGNPENLITSGEGPIYFNTDSNNFYYKSTKFQNNQFVGQSKYLLPLINLPYTAVNDRNLWFPTTIMDLGPRDQFTKQICFDPNFEGYLVDTLKSTSYSDTSEIVNMFIISRLSNSTWLGRITNSGNASINALFSRSGDRVDGDVAQLFSINSEFGVLPFLGTNYTDDKLYVGQDSVSNGPVLGIFFDSNRQLRQLLSPGTTPYTYFGYPKTQTIPFYRWSSDSTTSIFGNDENNWNTNTPIQSSKYQNLDFDTSPYFKFDTNINNDKNLGYIYNQYPSGTPNENWPSGQNINYLVGAPYHFYFGLKRGNSAMNKFITKYII